MCSAKVPSGTPKHKKAGMCLPEMQGCWRSSAQACVTTVSCEFNVNESAMSIKHGVPKQNHTHETGTCMHQLKLILWLEEHNHMFPPGAHGTVFCNSGRLYWKSPWATRISHMPAYALQWRRTPRNGDICLGFFGFTYLKLLNKHNFKNFIMMFHNIIAVIEMQRWVWFYLIHEWGNWWGVAFSAEDNSKFRISTY